MTASEYYYIEAIMTLTKSLNRKIETVHDARVEKETAFERLIARNAKSSAVRFEVVDNNGRAVLNPMTQARANRRAAELDLLTPSYAPHAIRVFGSAL